MLLHLQRAGFAVCGQKGAATGKFSSLSYLNTQMVKHFQSFFAHYMQ